MVEHQFELHVPDYTSQEPVVAAIESTKLIEEKVDKELVDKVKRRVIKGQIDGT